MTDAPSSWLRRARGSFGSLGSLSSLGPVGSVGVLCAMLLGLSLPLASAASNGVLSLSFPAAPGNASAAAARALAAIDDLDVVLLRAEIDLSSEAQIFVRDAGWEDRRLGGCDFGEEPDLAEVSLPVDDTHLLATVRPGDPMRHAANGVFCEYAPETLTVDGKGARLVVRGCFLALSVSIPTAREIVFNPLPASACGLHD